MSQLFLLDCLQQLVIPILLSKIEYDQDYFCVVNIMRIAQSYYQLLSMVCHSPYINYTI